MISDNLTRIQQQIAQICQKAGRNPKDVLLVGVTKYADAQKIKEAIDAGLLHIGENKVQMAQEKFPALDQLGCRVTKHLIGHLQSNKAKQAVELFDMIQSVDSFKLAREINKYAEKLNKPMDILIQVNISGEEQKSGTTADDALKMIQEILTLPAIRIKGLMTMAPLTEDKNIIRACFRGLRQLSERLKNEIKHPHLSMQYLSMGMSGDFDIALEEGASIVRIGSAIFQ